MQKNKNLIKFKKFDNSNAIKKIFSIFNAIAVFNYL